MIANILIFFCLSVLVVSMILSCEDDNTVNILNKSTLEFFAFYPNSGYHDDTIRIMGSGFEERKKNLKVFFGASASEIIDIKDSMLLVRVPLLYLDSCIISINDKNATLTSANYFFYKDTVQIIDFYPKEIRAGDTLEITGFGFGNNKNNIVLKINEIYVEPFFVSDTLLKIKINDLGNSFVGKIKYMSQSKKTTSKDNITYICENFVFEIDSAFVNLIGLTVVNHKTSSSGYPNQMETKDYLDTTYFNITYSPKNIFCEAIGDKYRRKSFKDTITLCYQTVKNLSNSSMIGSESYGITIFSIIDTNDKIFKELRVMRSYSYNARPNVDGSPEYSNSSQTTILVLYNVGYHELKESNTVNINIDKQEFLSKLNTLQNTVTSSGKWGHYYTSQSRSDIEKILKLEDNFVFNVQFIKVKR